MKSFKRPFVHVGVSIFIVTITLLVISGWYVWQAQQKSPTAANSTTQNNVFRLEGLVAEFDLKSDIKPVYTIRDYSYNGISYKLIHMSTQQLIEKGEADGTPNICKFKRIAKAGKVS